MSTYTRPDKFVPINISSDPSAYLDYVQKRADLSAQGEAAIKLQYKQYLDMDLTHQGNQMKLDEFLNKATKELNKNVNIDTSNFENVQKALSLFDPLTKDPQYESVLYDNRFTKHYKSQLAYVNELKTKADKKGNVGVGYNNANYEDLMFHYNKFARGDSDNYSRWGSLHSYQPYYDYSESFKERALEFMKLPDEYEQEHLDPNTGLVTKIKYQGKSADQLRLFLENTMSSKEKSQLLLEGRVEARKIEDDQFVNMFKETSTSNLKNLNNQLTDLEVFKKANGKTLSEEEYKQKKNQILAQIKSEQTQLDELEIPEKKSVFINNKEDIYSQYHIGSKLSKISMALENKRPSLSYGTNAAYVSLLDRQQHAQELLAKMQQTQANADRQYEIDKGNLEVNRFKAGMKIDGSGPISSQDLYKATPAGSDLTEDEILKKVEQEKKDMENAQSAFLQDVAKDAYIINGFTPTVNVSKRLEQDKKALATVMDIKNQYLANNPDLLKLTSIPDKDLSAQDLAKKRIIVKLQEEDALVTKMNLFNSVEKETKAKARQEIRQALQKAGINNPEDLKLNGGALDSGINALANSILPGGQLLSSMRDAYKGITRPKTMDELVERILNDGDFAKEMDRAYFKNYNLQKGLTSATISGAGALLENVIPGAGPVSQMYNMYNTFSDPESLIFSTLRQSYAKELSKKTFLFGMQEVFNKPVEQKTDADKAKTSLFFEEVNRIYSNPSYAKVIGDQLPLEGVTSIYKTDGKYIVEGYNKTIINKTTGDVVVSPEAEKVRVEIPVPSLQITNKENAYYVSALAGSPNGSIEKQYVSPSTGVKTTYNIRTSSGTPYVSYSENPDLLRLSIKLGDREVFLPDSYTDPLSAIKGMKAFMNKLESVAVSSIFKEKYQEALLATKGDANAALKYVNEKYGKEIRALVQEKLDRMNTTGSIYDAFGLSNPNLTPAEQQFQDLINSQ